MVKVFLLVMVGWQAPQTSTVQVPDMHSCEAVAKAINATGDPNIRASCLASTATQ